MTDTKEKTAGILGGMGPEATVDLMQRIIRNTPARDDVDHIHCLVDNNPKVPSRIRALIEKTGESPGPAMADMGRRLEAAGADFLAIACNTAHYYYEDVRRAVGIPVLHMVELTVAHVADTLPEVRTVGILASPAVRMTGLYEERFTHRGIRAIFPSPAAEEGLFAVIRAVKGGNTGPEIRTGLAAAVEDLAGQGAQTAVVACTELGVLDGTYVLPLVDAAEVLARAIVREAGG